MHQILKGRVFGAGEGNKSLWREALVVKDNRIVGVGEFAPLKQAHPGAEVIDFGGRLIFPGFADAHLHLAAGGRSLGLVDLSGLSLVEVRESLLTAADGADGSDWIEAFNLDAHLAPVNAELLEQWLPGRAVMVHKRDLHSAYLSRSALRRIGISVLTADTSHAVESVDGRRAEGLLVEEEVEAARRRLPQPSRSVRRGWILQGQAHLIRLGITAACEVLDDGNQEIYRELDASGELKLDIDGWLRVEEWDGSPPPGNGGRFRQRTLKLFLDGAFGARTAAVGEAYLDGSDNYGVLLYTDERLKSLLARAARTGWRVAMHAIGDRAAVQACRALVSLPAEFRPAARLEHFQQVPAELPARLAAVGAAASIQPVHLLDDGIWLPKLLGVERCRRSFIWRSLIEAGMTVALGSDWPVASPDPLLTQHVSINRRGFTEVGFAEFQTGEELTPLQAIQAATVGWAAAAGRLGERGYLMPGELADITIVEGVDESMRDWSGGRVAAVLLNGEWAANSVN